MFDTDVVEKIHTFYVQ